MKYSPFIFDFDFTLADATPGIVESVNYALGRLDFPAQERDAIRKTVGMTLRNAFALFTGEKEHPLTEDFLALFKERADLVMTDSTALFDDTVAVLTKLRQVRCQTAIVTSKYRYRIEEVLKKKDIGGLFDFVIGFEDVEAHKPSPEGLLKAVARFGAESASVLYVGDSLIDAHTALNASIDFAAVTTGTTTAQDFEKLPHVCIAGTLSRLLAWASE